MRSLTEIKNVIKEAFVSNISIIDEYGLDATKSFDEQFSTVSIEAIIILVAATAIWVFEAIQDSHEYQIEQTIKSQAVSSIPWYYSLCLSFQLGYNLEFDSNTYSFGYSVIDESAKIIKYAAVRELESEGVTILRIYVSKANKVPLSSTELLAFSAYMNTRGAAGTHYEIVTEMPTPLAFTIQIIRNPMMLDSAGLSLNSGTNPVNVAISSYLDSITYGAVFNRTKFVDAIQNVDGVEDVILNEVRIGTEPILSQNIESPGGAFQFDYANSIISYMV